MSCRSFSVKPYIRNVPDDDVRGPHVITTLTMQQPAEYLLSAKANDERAHLQQVGLCTVQLLCHQVLLLDGAWKVCDRTGPHFLRRSLTQKL